MKEIHICEKLVEMDNFDELLEVFREWCMEHEDAADQLIEKLDEVI